MPSDRSSSRGPRTRKPVVGQRRRTWKIILITVAVLLSLRIALPCVALHFANKRLAHMPGYYGHVEDIDIALIRGAYVIRSFFLDQVDSTSQGRTPFLAAGAIDLSLEWKALFHGAIVGELVIDHPRVIFTLDSVEPAEVQKDTADFRDLLHDFMPLRVDRVEMHGGELVYRDPKARPSVDMRMRALEVLATNLRNSYDPGVALPAKVTASAMMYDGRMSFNMALNPLSRRALFDLNAKLEDMDLVQVNDFFQAYANVDVNKGRFSLYTEMATRDGEFTGYIKPVLKDVDVLGPEDRDEPLLHRMWEALAGAAGAILTNPSKEQVATKIEMKGNLSNPNVSTWYAVLELLRNAFIRALAPALDNEIDLNSIRGANSEGKGSHRRLARKKNDP